jgi:hypothetical protein
MLEPAEFALARLGPMATVLAFASFERKVAGCDSPRRAWDAAASATCARTLCAVG